MSLIEKNRSRMSKAHQVPNQPLPNESESSQASSLPMPITELLDADYHGVRLYTVAMLVLVVAILWTGISVVEQVQTYQERYTELSQLKKDYRQLQIEHQRMLIEQQTFSATPQIVNRAVTQLHMFYPDLSNRLIIRVVPTQSNALPPNALPVQDPSVSLPQTQGEAHD